MVTDTGFLDKHFATGVGKYDANWDSIEAEWYMKADKVSKSESPNDGFEIREVQNGGSLCFPNMANLDKQKAVVFCVSSIQGATIEVRADHPLGRLLGSCEVPVTGRGESYADVECALNEVQGVRGICIVFKGTGEELLHLDRFRFSD